MITTPTVLVFGAGASLPYGFPTAKGSKELICEQFSSTGATASQLLSCRNPEGSKFVPEEFSKFRQAFLNRGSHRLMLFTAPARIPSCRQSRDRVLLDAL